MIRVAFIAAVALLAGCSSHTRLSPQEQKGILRSVADKSYWLRCSMNVGQLYGDATRFLVHPRAFDELRLLQDSDGSAIYPPPPRGIIPAGTVVVLKRVEFPAGWAMMSRSIYSPRYCPWLELYIPRYDNSKPYILPLRLGIENAKKFREELDLYLSEDDISEWLAQRAPEARRLIAEKKLGGGMQPDEVTAAWGYPDGINRSFDGKGGGREEWLYGKRKIVFENGKLIAPAAAQPEPAAAAEPAPSGQPPAPPTSHAP